MVSTMVEIFIVQIVIALLQLSKRHALKGSCGFKGKRGCLVYQWYFKSHRICLLMYDCVCIDLIVYTTMILLSKYLNRINKTLKVH